jgi:hypothetical protein
MFVISTFSVASPKVVIWGGMWDFVSFFAYFAKAPLHRKIFSCRISANFNHCANRVQLLFTVCLQEKRCRGEVFMCCRTGDDANAGFKEASAARPL